MIGCYASCNIAWTIAFMLIVHKMGKYDSQLSEQKCESAWNRLKAARFSGLLADRQKSVSTSSICLLIGTPDCTVLVRKSETVRLGEHVRIDGIR